MVTWGTVFNSLRSDAFTLGGLHVTQYVMSRPFGFCESCGTPTSLEVTRVDAGSSPRSFAAVCKDCKDKEGLYPLVQWLEDNLDSQRLLYVTAAVIRQGDEVLVCERRPKPGEPPLWEFPGGKMGEGESLAQCLVREIHEELCLDIEAVEPFRLIDHDYGKVKLRLFALSCEIREESGPIVLNDHLSCCWQPIKDLRALTFSQADLGIVEALEKN